jgi:hypothetical protein
MSTVYGSVMTREGIEIAADAYGVARNVKLLLDNTKTSPGALTLTTPEDVRSLISALNLCIEHVWGHEEKYDG